MLNLSSLSLAPKLASGFHQQLLHGGSGKVILQHPTVHFHSWMFLEKFVHSHFFQQGVCVADELETYHIEGLMACLRMVWCAYCFLHASWQCCASSSELMLLSDWRWWASWLNPSAKTKWNQWLVWGKKNDLNIFLVPQIWGLSF